MTDEVFAAALSLDHPTPGSSDRIHVATCAVNGIGSIVSADRGFDGIRGLRRVDPLDERAVRRLLSA